MPGRQFQNLNKFPIIRTLLLDYQELESVVKPLFARKKIQKQVLSLSFLGVFQVNFF